MTLLPLATALLMAASFTPHPTVQAWHWEASRPAPVVAPSASAVAELGSKVAELARQRDQIRGRIGSEPDSAARQRLYGQLHDVGLELAPLERQLAAARARR